MNRDFEFLTKAQTEDFINYGFEPEFIGRLPVRIACKALGEAELEQILSSSEGSIVKQYREDFSGYGIDLQLDSGALHGIAQFAAKEQTGARGLLTVLERIFRDIKFELPSTNVREITLDAAAVENPQKYLEQLLISHGNQGEDVRDGIERFRESFEGNCDIRLDFSDEAVEEIARIARERRHTIVATCNRLFEDFAYGLRLLVKEGEKMVLEVSLEAVRDPDRFLSEKIAEYYGK
ncbi:MAG: hypothetical protein LBN94_03005 [Puniceicoccales bacterium]|jgi:ATP-dependent protease Clp ATPase subunit|nr:hypothetical protein [Puniceicoccales bacterium]